MFRPSDLMRQSVMRIAASASSARLQSAQVFGRHALSKSSPSLLSSKPAVWTLRSSCRSFSSLIGVDGDDDDELASDESSLYEDDDTVGFGVSVESTPPPHNPSGVIAFPSSTDDEDGDKTPKLSDSKNWDMEDTDDDTAVSPEEVEAELESVIAAVDDDDEDEVVHNKDQVLQSQSEIDTSTMPTLGFPAMAKPIQTPRKVRMPPAVEWGNETSVVIPYGGPGFLTESPSTSTNPTATLTFGQLANRADSACVAQVGGTSVLATVVVLPSVGRHQATAMFSVDYISRAAASGQFPQGQSKRERLGDEDVLGGRVIDRSLRPMMPETSSLPVAVVVQVLSYDGENDPVLLGVNAASVALSMSSAGWPGAEHKLPVAAMRVGKIDGKLVMNPPMSEYSDTERCTLNLVVAGDGKNVYMIEANAKEIPEPEFEEALRFSMKAIGPMANAIEQLRTELGYHGLAHIRPMKIRQIPESLIKLVSDSCRPLAMKMMSQPNVSKKQREIAQSIFWKEANAVAAGVVETHVATTLPTLTNRHTEIIETYKQETIHEVLRRAIVDSIFGDTKDGRTYRADDRELDELRPLSCTTDEVPHVHGSAVFSRGITQVFSTVTLAPKQDAMARKDLCEPSRVGKGNAKRMEKLKQHYFLHYDFPQYSVNSIGMMDDRANRRAIGHGALAEKAIRAVMPPEGSPEFPYAVRITAEVMASDGSTSMAAVCGASLALMDAGVPITRHVAGISTGLVLRTNGQHKFLTDILGMEDHFTGMDYKVAGTTKGITAAQLDIKLPGVPVDLICNAGRVSRKARLKILKRMSQCIDLPKRKASSPRYHRVNFGDRTDLVGLLVGAGGSSLELLQNLGGLKSARIEILPDDRTVEIYAETEEVLGLVMAKIGELINSKEAAEAKAPKRLPRFRED